MRFGERINDGSASFRCATCREVAAVVKAVPAGEQVDMGPPLGHRAWDRDGFVVDYFLGTAWKLAEDGAFARVREIIASDAPDPEELRQIEWELAPLYCPQCRLNYCSADWNTYVLFDDGFYDCTMGTCPNAHKHMIDD